MIGGRFPSVTTLKASFIRSPIEGSSGLPPPAQPFGCLQAGFLWIAVADSAALLSTTFHHSPSLTGWSTHSAPEWTWLSSIHGWRPGGDRFHVPRVPLTREPTCTRAIDPGASGSTLTPANTSRPSRSSGYFPDFPWSGFPWLAHGSPLHGDWFPNPTGLLFGVVCRPSALPFCALRPATSRSPLSLPATGPIPVSHPASRVYTHRAASNPLARAHSPFRGPFRARGTGRSYPIPYSRARPVVSLLFPLPGPIPVSHSASRVYTPPGRQQPFGAGPLSHPGTVSRSWHGSLLPHPLVPGQ